MDKVQILWQWKCGIITSAKWYTNSVKSSMESNETLHRKTVLNQVQNYVQVNVIENDNPVLGSYLLKIFKDVFTSNNPESVECESYTVQIRSKFSDSVLSIHSEGKRRIVIWETESYCYKEALRIAEEKSSGGDQLIWKCA